MGWGSLIVFIQSFGAVVYVCVCVLRGSNSVGQHGLGVILV